MNADGSSEEDCSAMCRTQLCPSYLERLPRLDHGIRRKDPMKIHLSDVVVRFVEDWDSGSRHKEHRDQHVIRDISLVGVSGSVAVPVASLIHLQRH